MILKITPSKLSLFHGTKPTWYKISQIAEYQERLTEIEKDLTEKYKKIYTDYLLKYAQQGRRLKIKVRKNTKKIHNLIYANNNTN
jgi:hypothetical protein